VERRFAELLGSVRSTLEFCQLRPSESVVILCDTATASSVRDAFHTGALVAGAEVIVVTMTTRAGPLSNPPEPAVHALMEADLVVDLASHAWLYTDATNRVLGAGARMLQVLVGEDTIITRPPTAAIAERERSARKLLETCEELRIFSPLGTDIVLRRGGRPVHTQGGFVDHPGDWDSLGVYLAAFAPPEDAANGELVLEGTLFLPTEHKLIVETPIRTVVEMGRLVHVDTSTAQGRLLADWLRSWDDPNAYVIAHTGFGLDERAAFVAPDSESFLAGVNIAFGANNIPQLQGQTVCRSHLDAVLRHASVEIDDVPIIHDGHFVEGHSIAEAGARPSIT
jgi:2,5-dihydroxypyridine 5,6-dioxygenase